MKISVVVPTYNEADTIGRCLESLQAQTRQPDEIIVVNNNCTDGTVVIAKSYKVQIINEAKQGIPSASHAGLNAARGDIIARCDADSILPTNWLEMIEQEFAAHPTAVAVTGPGKFYDTNKLAAAFAQVWYMYAYFILVGSAIAKWPLFGSNFAIRRDAWQKINTEVHADRTDIHDDIDVTMHLPADAQVVLSRKIAVGISARALRVNNLRKRYAWGIKSLTLHWPESSPYKRWEQKFK